MNYKETINYLFGLLPVYQNQGKSAIKKDLTNIIKLCDALDNPQSTFNSIHIGGTNGKGTVSHMTASILQESGLKVGLYTSPHYVDFRERLKINGEYISQEEVVDFVKSCKSLIEEIRPSFFELTVAMAFDHFKRHKVDYAVIEVGLGGRLDSTNVILPEISVITNIGLDHTDMLGTDIPSIANEKAGIIKKSTPVVIGEYHPESAPVFELKAKSCNTIISFASKNWIVRTNIEGRVEVSNGIQNYNFDIVDRGPFFIKNTITTLETFVHSNFTINDIHIINGINKYSKNTNYQGRWQWLEKEQNVLLDSGHNEHALSKSISYLTELGYPKIHFVLGFVKEKDIDKIIEVLPEDGKYYLAKPSIFRGAEVQSYSASFLQRNLSFQPYISVSSAYKAALRCRNENELVFIGGSSFVVGEMLEGLNS